MQMAHLKDFSDGTSGIDVLNLQDDDGSASLKFQAPATVTTTTTFTLPDGDGSSGQVLDTNGSGTLAWTKVQASNLDVADNGTSGQALVSDGDGSFSWSTIAGYPQVITIKTSGDYVIPASATAIMIKASGGGGGGAAQALRDNGDNSDSGDDGGSTTVTNATLSISITADGGKGGAKTTTATSGQSGGSSGGDVLSQGGAFGGHGHFFQRNSAQGLAMTERGYNGDLVLKYVTGSDVGGETLSISYGSGGTGGSASDGIGTVTGSNGLAGYVEIWVW